MRGLPHTTSREQAESATRCESSSITLRKSCVLVQEVRAAMVVEAMVARPNAVRAKPNEQPRSTS
jgi:hypothetical protein